MKIIYEDGNDRNEAEEVSSGSFEFEDISSDSVRTPGAKKPVRPVHRPAPTLRQTAEKEEKKEEAGQPEQPTQFTGVHQPAFSNPYMQGVPQGYIPVQPYPQGYMPTPEQLAAMQQQYPQGYAVYPGMQGMPQGYMPPQYMPYQPQPPVQQTPVGEHNPGTRVLYQSPDFDRTERERNVMPFGQPVVKSGIVHEDVDYSDEPVPVKVSKAPRKAPSVRRTSSAVSFDEDDVEMSVFELNAMGPQKAATVRPVRQPGSHKTGVDVEDYEHSEEEFEDFGEDEALDPIEENEGKKKLPTHEIIRRTVLAISILLIVIASATLLNQWRLSAENKELEDEISNLIIDVTEPPTTKKPSKDKDKDKDKDKQQNETTKPAESTTVALTPAQQWEKLRSEYPNVIFPVNLQLKYAKLYATNQDFVGYLSADGVNLSLPIVQTDNDEDYMNKNFYGKTTKYGCPFVTHLNNIEELDMNTVIFGHHMNNGTVFGALDKYKSIEGFKKAPVITFNTMYKDYQWKVIAAFVTNAYEKDDNGYIFRYYFTSLSTEERYSAFLSELSQRSLYDTGVDVLPTDKILTLSTCSHEFTDARFVVVARLVRNGETAEVDVSKAIVNTNPRYPQAYYDKKGKENPYKNASRWEVG